MTVPKDEDLPNFDDVYMQIFNQKTKGLEVRRRSRATGTISLQETMELCAKLLRRYQLTYWPHSKDPKLIWFPFLYKQPVKGVEIQNVATNEVYTVDHPVVDRETGEWDGLIKLNLTTPPSTIRKQSLTFRDHDNFVRFDHESPSALPNLVGANIEGVLKNAPPLEPTVTWNIERTEPGGRTRPFDDRKIDWKPSLRESVKDPLKPGYTVDIYGQIFDNLVQFDCWTNDSRSSEKLYVWFEQFLREYTWVFQQLGVSQMFFWERMQDRVSTTWRQYFPVRTMRWFFRTETLKAVYSRDILNLDISVDVNENPTTNTHTINFPEQEGYRWIADQPVSGKLTYDQYRDLFYRSGEYLFGGITLNQ